MRYAPITDYNLQPGHCTWPAGWLGHVTDSFYRVCWRCWLPLKAQIAIGWWQRARKKRMIQTGKKYASARVHRCVFHPIWSQNHIADAAKCRLINATIVMSFPFASSSSCNMIADLAANRINNENAARIALRSLWCFAKSFHRNLPPPNHTLLRPPVYSIYRYMCPCHTMRKLTGHQLSGRWRPCAL